MECLARVLLGGNGRVNLVKFALVTFKGMIVDGRGGREESSDQEGRNCLHGCRRCVKEQE